jgi:hypothetical protein
MLLLEAISHPASANTDATRPAASALGELACPEKIKMYMYYDSHTIIFLIQLARSKFFYLLLLITDDVFIFYILTLSNLILYSMHA